LAFLVRQHDLFAIPCIKLTSQNDYTRKAPPIVIKTFSLLLYFSKEATQLAQKPHVRLFVFPLQNILISEQVFKHCFYFWIKRESLSYYVLVDKEVKRDITS
jgi:hypothetical protein